LSIFARLRFAVTRARACAAFLAELIVKLHRMIQVLARRFLGLRQELTRLRAHVLLENLQLVQHLFMGHNLPAYEMRVELLAQLLRFLSSAIEALLGHLVVQQQQLVARLIANGRLGHGDPLTGLSTILIGGAQVLPGARLIAILSCRRPRFLARLARLSRLPWLISSRLRRQVTLLSRRRAAGLAEALIRTRGGAESLRLPPTWATPFLKLLHEVGMVLLEQLTELLDFLVFRRLLGKLRKRDLLVVVDDQQGDDAGLQLLPLQAGTANLAGLPRLPRLNNLSGLSRLNNLPGLSWLPRTRLAGARLGRLGLCQYQCGAPEEHRARAGGATK
jgi:hypothetical protein